MSRFLFAYGTLQFPAVFRVVAGRTLPGDPAVLDGYARFLVRGQRFPGIVPYAGANTEGVLYRGVTDEDLARLDRFEGPLYERAALTVRSAGGARRAWCYVVAPRQRQRLSELAWDPADFEANYLAGFLRRSP